MVPEPQGPLRASRRGQRGSAARASRPLASGVPSVPAAEAAGPRATVLGPPLAGRSRLTHTEQVCCQRAFQVSTWRPFPRRGRGRPATPPSVSPQTRGAGCRATRTARATRDREKAGGVAPAGPGPPWLGSSLHLFMFVENWTPAGRVGSVLGVRVSFLFFLLIEPGGQS